jgi:hypothetical protein
MRVFRSDSATKRLTQLPRTAGTRIACGSGRVDPMKPCPWLSTAAIPPPSPRAGEPPGIGERGAAIRYRRRDHGPADWEEAWAQQLPWRRASAIRDRPRAREGEQ